GRAEYCGAHYVLGMVAVTLSKSRRRKPPSKIRDSAVEEDSEEAVSRERYPVENENAPKGKGKQTARKSVPGSTSSLGAEKEGKAANVDDSGCADAISTASTASATSSADSRDGDKGEAGIRTKRARPQILPTCAPPAGEGKEGETKRPYAKRTGNGHNDTGDILC
ncbi:unnamed protein product, partial [Ectocarpus sp. 6 AP-2014]